MGEDDGKKTIDEEAPKKTIEEMVEAKSIKPEIAKKWKLTHNQITLDKKLGEGAFGEVHSGKLKMKSKRLVEVAVKVAKLDNNKEILKEIMQEAHIMRNFDHPNVVRLYGVAIEKEPLMLVMELVDGPALDSYLQKHSATVKLQEKLDFMCNGAAWGLEYLHMKSCIHRDVAARNCLYSRNTVKISDFGLSREGDYYQMTTAKRLPIKWLAPETLTTGIYTAKSDVFSFGILIWEIFANGVEPYLGMNNGEVQTKVLEGYRMELSADVPDNVVALITKHCWDSNADTRWTMAQVARELEKITGCTQPDPKKKSTRNTVTTEGTVEMTTVEEGVKEKTKECPPPETKKTMAKSKEGKPKSKEGTPKSKDGTPKTKEVALKSKEPPRNKAKSTTRKAASTRRRATAATRKKKTRGG